MRASASRFRLASRSARSLLRGAAAAALLAASSGCRGVVVTPPRRTAAEIAAREAERLLDIHRRTGAYPYVFGGNPRYDAQGRIVGGTFDCSALVQHCYRQAGVSLPRVSRRQARAGRRVSRRRLRRGDVLAFDTDADGVVNHVGLYIGGGRMIHASGSEKGIGEARLAGHWAKTLVAARRP
ncbi:MAG: C40 family peptidase [Kiritimatiellia bacterium]|jgi:cell wall-associated NlpC family hydrolase